MCLLSNLIDPRNPFFIKVYFLQGTGWKVCQKD
jgi:hypothetical protein